MADDLFCAFGADDLPCAFGADDLLCAFGIMANLATLNTEMENACPFLLLFRFSVLQERDIPIFLLVREVYAHVSEHSRSRGCPLTR